MGSDLVYLFVFLTQYGREREGLHHHGFCPRTRQSLCHSPARGWGQGLYLGCQPGEGEDTLAGLRERFGQDKVCFVMCDVTKEEQFVNLFDKTEEFFKVSCVDLLANNAGVNLNFGWRKCMEINIISVMLGTDIALERMRKAGKSGQIINTASMAGFAPGLSEKMAAYTVSKHGVVALTRTMGKTTAGVAHKCICPSW